MNIVLFKIREVKLEFYEVKDITKDVFCFKLDINLMLIIGLNLKAQYKVH